MTFDMHRDMLGKHHRENAALYRNSAWRDAVDGHQRNLFFRHLSSQIVRLRSEFNDGSLPFVVPGFTGITEQLGRQVAEQGFAGMVPAEGGYFGKGLYFSSVLPHATALSPGGDVKVCLLSLVIPGNPYPITEPPFVEAGQPNPAGLAGKPCRQGYQSHYTLVDTDPRTNPFPTKLSGDPADHVRRKLVADELVVFDAAQALPLFLFSFRAPPIGHQASSSASSSKSPTSIMILPERREWMLTS